MDEGGRPVFAAAVRRMSGIFRHRIAFHPILLYNFSNFYKSPAAQKPEGGNRDEIRFWKQRG
jgi:hypothetical protein